MTNKMEASETNVHMVIKNLLFHFQWHYVSCVVKLVAGFNKEQKLLLFTFLFESDRSVTALSIIFLFFQGS